MISRLPLVALVLVCGVARCEAAPLSFNGVQLGQKWEAFVKAHPKAEVLWPSDEEMLLTKTQQLAKEAKKKQPSLVEQRSKELFSVFYSFTNGSLTQATFISNFNTNKRGLQTLSASLNKILVALRNPNCQGVSTVEVGGPRGSMLVWTTPTQSAFARIEWHEEGETGYNVIVLCLVDAPWRATTPKFQTFWPAVLSPTPDDEARRLQLFALMEHIRPRSTEHIEQLKPAPAINLFEKKTQAVKPKGPAVVIKPAK